MAIYSRSNSTTVSTKKKTTTSTKSVKTSYSSSSSYKTTPKTTTTTTTVKKEEPVVETFDIPVKNVNYSNTIGTYMAQRNKEKSIAAIKTLVSGNQKVEQTSNFKDLANNAQRTTQKIQAQAMNSSTSTNMFKDIGNNVQQTATRIQAMNSSTLPRNELFKNAKEKGVFNYEKKTIVDDKVARIADGIVETGASIYKSGKKVVTTEIQSYKDLCDGKISYGEYLKQSGATLGEFGISVLEGVGRWGEKAWDAINLGTNYLIGKAFQATGQISEDDFYSVMGGVTKDISQNNTKYIYDYIYEDTSAGQTIKNNARNFEEVRQAGNMAGEVAMNVGLAYAGGQIGGKIATSKLGTVGSELTAEQIAAINCASNIGTKATLGTASGVTGFGEGAEQAYANGATVDEGIKAGAINGAWNATQYLVGQQINNTNPFKSEIGNAFLHIGLDTVDGGSEGFVQPLIQMTYADGYYDSNGNYTKFTGNESFNEKYHLLFESNGGYEAVGQQALMSGMMSAVSEVGGIAKSLRDKPTDVEKIKQSYLDGTSVTEELPVMKNYDKKITSGEIPDNYKQSSRNITQADIDYYNKMYEIKSSPQHAEALNIIDNYKQLGLSNEQIKLKTGIDVDAYNKFEADFRELQSGVFDKSKKSVDYYKNKNQTIENGIDNWFEKISENSGQYGVGQGALDDLYYYKNKITGEEYNTRYINDMIKSGNITIPYDQLEKVGTSEYGRIKQRLIDHGFSKQDASAIISGVDSTGACGYASACNEILNAYKYNPTKFKQDFGFDMYILKDGNYELNASELLVDMYIYANDIKNGGNLIQNNKVIGIDDSVNDLYGRGGILNSSEQQYMTDFISGRNKDLLNNYLKDKNSNLRFNTSVIVDTSYIKSGSNIATVGRHNINGSFDIDTIRNIGNRVNLDISQGKNISMNIATSDFAEIRMIPLDEKSPFLTTNSWNEGAAHSVFITGASDDGFIASSWSGKYIIPYEDLTNGSIFQITSSEIDQKKWLFFNYNIQGGMQ